MLVMNRGVCQERAVARNHVFPELIVYDLFRSWHTSKIVDFEPYAMAVKKLKEAVHLTVTFAYNTYPCVFRSKSAT